MMEIKTTGFPRYPEFKYALLFYMLIHFFQGTKFPMGMFKVYS